MDKYSGKRGAGGCIAPRKEFNVALKDTAPARNGGTQYCNRIGCSGKMKYGQSTKIRSSDKAKESQQASRSSNGNELTRNPSRNGPMMTSARKSFLDSKRKLSSQLGFDASESSISSESEAPVSPPSRSQAYQSESMKKSGKFTVTEEGSSSQSSKNGPRKIFHQRSRSNNQITPPASSASLVSKSSTLRPSNSSNGNRIGLRNLKCNSISDVLPSSSSSTDSKSIGKNVMKNKSSEGESSFSSRERKTAATSSIDRYTSPSTSGISISDSNRSSASGETRGTAASVRTRRSININSAIRPSYRQNSRERLSFREPISGISQIPNNEAPFNVGGQSSSRHFSAIGSSSGTSSYSLSSSDSDNPSAMLTSTELNFSHLMNRDAFYHRYNMDGIAEVLLALESSENLTHEQAIALETSLFLSSLNLYDQHRDMRLDIDNMSYEELLALGERIGTVSTAVPEETLSKCLKRETYQITPSEVRVTDYGEDGDDAKCSICQEEYEMEDEIGKLMGCQHGFHETCIIQWLQLKNWCPICKGSAATSRPPPS